MATLEQAISLAAKQHEGQVDKANAPYILHPLRVMLNVPTEAAQRARQNPIARVVKLADINDNMDLSRIQSPTVKDFERLKEYQQVRDLLLQNV